MVKNRGIDVSIISQFDIQRLPEFEYPKSKDTRENNVVSCYIPIYPGSQIWFEYLVDPPHPPQAAYFFKLLINHQAITSWDCTEKHGYYGKMIYSLEKTQWPQQYPRTAVERRGLKFCDHEDLDQPEGDEDDYIELRVHRIEHRCRIYDEPPSSNRSATVSCGGRLRVISGGTLEPDRPQRRYKYQLVDPADEPYAVFRFFYRSFDYLKRQDIISVTAPSSSSASLEVWHNARSSSETNFANVNNAEADQTDHSTIITHSPSISPCKQTRSSIVSVYQVSPRVSHSFSNDVYLPLSDSDESLSVMAKDSIEDLHSTYLSGSDSPRAKRNSNCSNSQSVGSPPRHPSSPRQRLKNRLTLDLASAKHQTGKPTRPLSPFTSSGLLRRHVDDEAEDSERTLDSKSINPLSNSMEGSGMLNTADSDGNHSRASSRSSQPGRKGRSLMRFLSRRNYISDSKP